MWNISRVFTAYDAKKVFIGSFWDKPLNPCDFKDLMEENMQELSIVSVSECNKSDINLTEYYFQDLEKIQMNAAHRKIMLLSGQAKKLKAHAITINALANAVPRFLTFSKIIKYFLKKHPSLLFVQS